MGGTAITLLRQQNGSNMFHEHSSLKQSNLNRAISFIILDRIVIASFQSRISHHPRREHYPLRFVRVLFYGSLSNETTECKHNNTNRINGNNLPL